MTLRSSLSDYSKLTAPAPVAAAKQSAPAPQSQSPRQSQQLRRARSTDERPLSHNDVEAFDKWSRSEMKPTSCLALPRRRLSRHDWPGQRQPESISPGPICRGRRAPSPHRYSSFSFYFRFRSTNFLFVPHLLYSVRYPSTRPRTSILRRANVFSGCREKNPLFIFCLSLSQKI